MWLGSQQPLARLDIADVPVLSSTICIQQSARDLGVVIDSRLSLSEHVCCVPKRLLSTASTLTGRLMLVRGCHQDDGPGFHHQPPGLLQRTVLRHLR